MPESGRVAIGRIVKPHGIRGEVVVEATGETLASLSPGDSLWVGAACHRIVASRPHQGRWLMALEECADRDAAERLRGAVVSVAEERLRAPGQAEFFVDELVGARVETPQGRSLGVVTGVRSGGAHDLLETSDGALVPMVKEWLVRAADGLLVIDLPAGLLELEDGG